MRTPRNETFRFRCPTEIRCGVGITEDIVKHLDGFSTDRISVVVDKRLFSNAHVASAIEQLKAFDCQLIDGPDSEPDFEYLERVRQNAQNFDPSLVMGIGGGSTMDTAKGLAVTLTNSGPCSQFQGLELITQAGKPGFLFIGILNGQKSLQE